MYLYVYMCVVVCACVCVYLPRIVIESIGHVELTIFVPSTAGLGKLCLQGMPCTYTSVWYHLLSVVPQWCCLIVASLVISPLTSALQCGCLKLLGQILAVNLSSRGWGEPYWGGGLQWG